MSSGVTVVPGVLAGRYRLTSRIAAGGMGEVWRAQDTLLGRDVAVKLLRTDLLAGDDGRARFRAEARAAGRLTHAGIASVYDFGESTEQAWLVLELVDGEPLSAVLEREGRLSADHTLDVVAQAAAALQAAHTAGVVHRDVKPANLLVREDGAVKVTDFGIASSTGSATLTRAGDVLGTAGYLSPEQADGRGATAASDVYSLGVVAYECLSGRRPFVADTPVAVLYAHLQATPPPLPDDVPPALAALVLRMLAKDAEQRPAPAAALASQAAQLRTALQAPTRPDATRLLPRPGVRAPGRPSRGALAGVTSRSGQRRAVRATFVLLGVLALALGLGGPLLDRPEDRSSTTPAASTTRVPAIAAGTPVADAVRALESAGLGARQQGAVSDAVAAGRVLSQRPAGGAPIAAGASVLLVVSSGPALPDPPPAPAPAAGPDTGPDTGGQEGDDGADDGGSGDEAAEGAAAKAAEKAAEQAQKQAEKAAEDEERGKDGGGKDEDGR